MNQLDLKTQCACIVNDTAWIFSNEYNALFSWRLDSYKVEYVCSFEEEVLLASSLYTKMISYRNKIILIPCLAESLSHNLVIYDWLNEKTKYIPMPFSEKAVYFNAVKKGNRVLIFPVVYSSQAYLLDIEEESLDEINLDYGEYDNRFKEITGPLFCGTVWQDGVALYGIYGTHDILKLQMNDYKLFVEPQISSYGLYLLTQQGERVYGLDVHGQHIINIANGQENSDFTLPYKEKGNIFKNGNDMAYSQNVPLKNGGWLMIPVRGNDVLKVDSYGDIDRIAVNWYEIKCRHDEQAVATVQEYKNYIYAFPYQGNCIWKINVASKEIEYISCKVDGEILENLTIKHWSKSARRLVNEKEMELGIYFKVLAKWGVEEENGKSLIGKSIYQMI